MASKLELRQHPALLRGTAEAIPSPLPLAWIQPQSAVTDVQRPDACALASGVAGAGRELRTTAEATPAGAA
jgi:hypothetical protein